MLGHALRRSSNLARPKIWRFSMLIRLPGAPAAAGYDPAIEILTSSDSTGTSERSVVVA